MTILVNYLLREGANMTKKGEEKANKKNHPKRIRVSQSDIPKYTLREALAVAQAIIDNFAGQPTTPLQLAMALDISPTSSSWRYLTGSAAAYGLTNGTYSSEQIGLQECGRRTTAPTEENDDIKARAEAALKPTVFSQFFNKYNKAKFPADNIAKNVLQHDFTVPPDKVDDVLRILKDNGTFVGFIHKTKTGLYVSIDDLKPSPVTNIENQPEEIFENFEDKKNDISNHQQVVSAKIENTIYKVFITHGKNLKLVEQVKNILELYDIEYEISIEEETTAIPVPHKVLSAMRRCHAGIMIVSKDDISETSINNNVLIEIGAAFVLYDQRVVLLWDKKLKVPSNLQGLYRCDFDGDQLSFSDGTKLAKAVKDFRKSP